MALDVSLELQAAVYQALTDHAGLGTLAAGVYDHVPEGAPFPYVTIGDDVVTPLASVSPGGEDISLTIHTWSNAEGRHEVKKIMREVMSALLDAPITLAGYTVFSFEFEMSQTIPDVDEVTYHGIQRFRAQIHEGS